MSNPSATNESGEAAWRRAVAKASGGKAPEALARPSPDGFAVGPLYPMGTRAAPQPWRDMSKPVAVVQRIDDVDPTRAADLIRSDVEGGAGGVTLVLAGSPFARSFGLALDDFDGVLGAVDIARTALRVEFPAVAAESTLGRVLRAIEVGGVPPDHPGVDLAVDPLGFAADDAGASRSPAIRAAAGRWAGHLRRHGVTTAAFRADGRAHHEAGASAGQELAAVLSAGVLALRALEDAGLDGTGDGVRFTLVADTNLNLTVAKFRAFRRLWARVQAACGSPPVPVALHGETAWRLLARLDPWTNLPRTTIACAGAILGGADSVTVLPFTSAIGLADAFARRLARNIPLVLMEEAGLGRVADPSAGAGAYEALTAALCTEAWRIFQDLERGGGLPEALANGTWAASLATTAAARQADLGEGRATLVGVTSFRPPEAAPPPVLITVPPASAVAHRHAPGLPSRREAEHFEEHSPPAEANR